MENRKCSRGVTFCSLRLLLVLVIFYNSAFADHRSLQHRVHHGPHTRPQHRPESYPRHVRVERDHSGVEENEVIDEEPNGKIDFSKATPQKDGSLCVTKIKYMEKLEKTQVKECWHQNVSQCHDTFMTEFKPIQERICEENFWKACKITFKEVGYNYTLQTCMTPLVKKCEEPSYAGYGAPPPKEPKTVCKTWFESQCNTTYVQSEKPEEDPKPSTWCEKVPKKICAPDFCEMVAGPKECHDKTISSTVVKPEEVCDLQPSTQCRLVTNLVPHLVPQQVCKDIPKEVCHLKLDDPRIIKKPVTLRWCTKPKKDEPTKPSYLPPPQPVYAPQPPPTPAARQATYSSQPQPVYRSSAPKAPPPVTAGPAYYKPLPSSNKRKRNPPRQIALGRSGQGGRKSKLLTNDPQNVHW